MSEYRIDIYKSYLINLLRRADTIEGLMREPTLHRLELIWKSLDLRTCAAHCIAIIKRERGAMCVVLLILISSHNYAAVVNNLRVPGEQQRSIKIIYTPSV